MITKLFDYIITRIRNKYLFEKNFVKQNDFLNDEYAEKTGQEASNLIKLSLQGNTPVMIARIGASELTIMTEYLSSKGLLAKYFNFITGKTDSYRYNKTTMGAQADISGIFPSNKKLLDNFSQFMVEEIKEINILGTWLKNEILFKAELKKSKRIRLKDMLL